MNNEVGNNEVINQYPDQALQDIEDNRAKFLATYKKHNTLKIIVAIICFVLIIVAFMVLPNVLEGKEDLQKGLTIGITVFALALTLGYSTFTRKFIDKKMKEYFANYYSKVNEFAFKEDGFENVKLQNPGKINIEQFNEANLYKDIVDVGSRGLTEFEYKKAPMAIVDCAGNIKDVKRIRPVFVGKYLFSAANYLEKEPIIIYVKGNERSLPPTNLEGINKVIENEKYDVYSNNKDWKKVLKSDVIKCIEDIKTNEILVDLAISIKDGKVHIMMGYDDPLMVLPLQNPFVSKPIEMYKTDLQKVCKIVEALNK